MVTASDCSVVCESFPSGCIVIIGKGREGLGAKVIWFQGSRWSRSRFTWFFFGMHVRTGEMKQGLMFGDYLTCHLGAAT